MEKKKRPTVSDASAPDTAKHTASPTKQSRILRLLADGESLNRFEAERIGDHTLPSTISTLRHYHGLPLPRRLSNFHDCMGKLRALTYTGSISKDGRLDAKTLRPLAVRLPQRPDKDRTISRQGPDKDRTRPPDKETARAQVPQGLQSFSTTGQKSHGKTVIRENGNTGSPLSPELQSNDEWLADYSAAGRNVASRQ